MRACTEESIAPPQTGIPPRKFLKVTPHSEAKRSHRTQEGPEKDNHERGVQPLFKRRAVSHLNEKSKEDWQGSVARNLGPRGSHMRTANFRTQTSKRGNYLPREYFISLRKKRGMGKKESAIKCFGGEAEIRREVTVSLTPGKRVRDYLDERKRENWGECMGIQRGEKSRREKRSFFAPLKD